MAISSDLPSDGLMKWIIGHLFLPFHWREFSCLGLLTVMCFWPQTVCSKVLGRRTGNNFFINFSCLHIYSETTVLIHSCEDYWHIQPLKNSLQHLNIICYSYLLHHSWLQISVFLSLHLCSLSTHFLFESPWVSLITYNSLMRPSS